MPDVWRIGDVAECIDTTHQCGYLRMGGRYEVTVVVRDFHGEQWLGFAGDWRMWMADQFRPAWQRVEGRR